MDLQKAEKRKLNTNVLNVRSEFLICGIIRYTLDGKHFWQYYHSKQILEIYKKLLESTLDVKEVPATDNWKSNKRRNKNPKTIIVEKFKLEISLQDLLSEKSEIRLSNVDGNIIKPFSVNYESNTYDKLIELFG